MGDRNRVPSQETGEADGEMRQAGAIDVHRFPVGNPRSHLKWFEDRPPPRESKQPRAASANSCAITDGDEPLPTLILRLDGVYSNPVALEVRLPEQGLVPLYPFQQHLAKARQQGEFCRQKIAWKVPESSQRSQVKCISAVASCNPFLRATRLWGAIAQDTVRVS